MQNCIKSRHQKVNNTNSSLSKIIAGVLQGSILESLFFSYLLTNYAGNDTLCTTGDAMDEVKKH